MYLYLSKIQQNLSPTYLEGFSAIPLPSPTFINFFNTTPGNDHRMFCHVLYVITVRPTSGLPSIFLQISPFDEHSWLWLYHSHYQDTLRTYTDSITIMLAKHKKTVGNTNPLLLLLCTLLFII